MQLQSQIENLALKYWNDSAEADFVRLSRIPCIDARFYLDFRQRQRRPLAVAFDSQIFSILWNGTEHSSAERPDPSVSEFLAAKLNQFLQWRYLAPAIRREEARLLLQYIREGLPRRPEFDAYLRMNGLTECDLMECVNTEIDRREFARITQKMLTRNLGENPLKIPGASFMYLSHFRTMSVRTFVDFGGHECYASYWHLLEKVGIRRTIVWPDLACASGVSRWDDLRPGRRDDVAKLLVDTIALSIRRFSEMEH